jgi:hypothetical protein
VLFVNKEGALVVVGFPSQLSHIVALSVLRLLGCAAVSHRTCAHMRMCHNAACSNICTCSDDGVVPLACAALSPSFNSQTVSWLAAATAAWHCNLKFNRQPHWHCLAWVLLRESVQGQPMCSNICPGRVPQVCMLQQVVCDHGCVPAHTRADNLRR